MGWRIRIFEEFCKGCMLCVELCPHQVFERTNRLNRRGYFLPAVAHPERCRGCMVCEHICPDMAIEVERAEKLTPRP